MTISAVQCWTAMEEYFGVVPCTIMSMMSENLIPCCLRSGCLSARSACTLWRWLLKLPAHCSIGTITMAMIRTRRCVSTAPTSRSIFSMTSIMDFQAIIAGTVGKENTFGTCVGRVKAGAMSYARFSTDDRHGEMRGYVGEGRFTNDPLETFGGAGVVEIPRMQELLRFICEEGFEHHVAANFSQTAGAVYEAASNYLDWNMYFHAPEGD